MAFYLGLDSSTQSLTAMVVEIDGGARGVVFEHSFRFDDEFPEYGTSNGVVRGSDPREVWSSPLLWADALDRMMAIVSREAGIDLSQLLAVSASGQQHGSVYFTADALPRLGGLDPRQPLARQLQGIFSRDQAPVWMDESTRAQCDAIERTLGGSTATARLTGSAATERFTGPQIRKFHERDPAAYARTARIHLVSSYIASLLAGADAPIDPGDGAGMNLMDIHAREWSRAALEATAPDLASKLPRLQPSWSVVGPLALYWQKRYGFPAASVIAASGDNPCSLVGSGLVREGSIAVSLGTSDTVFVLTREPRIEASGAHAFGSPTGDYMSLICFKNGSLARERVRDRYGLDWDGFNRALAATPPGNNGALMLPWFEPEITPRVNEPGVRRHNLDPADAAANVRAVVEAQMMAMANHSEAITGGRATDVLATGGASANRAILQVMADVFGAPVSQLPAGNSACLGAALRAYHAHQRSLGNELPWREITRGFTEPIADSRIDPAHRDVYVEARRRYAEFEREELGRTAHR
jgi:xylulokinase